MIASLMIPILALMCLHPLISPSVALLLGIFIALTLGNPYSNQTSKWIRHLLALSVVGLGAGMNLHIVAQVGFHSILATAINIIGVLGIGVLIGKYCFIPEKISFLISVGTGICGGSAIATIVPLLRANHHESSIALSVVFILNAVALILFPIIGHHLNLTQEQFGLWSALAIHDTSSVVGATAQYGEQALEIGTITKLTRALWIMPVALIVGVIAHKKYGSDDGGKPYKPWFILGFILMAAAFTWIPTLHPYESYLVSMSKRGLSLTLFFIGASLTWDTVKVVGFRPFIQGILLWLITMISTLYFILKGVI